MSHSRTTTLSFTLPLPPSTLSILTFTTLTIRTLSPSASIPLPPGFTWLGLLGFSAIFGGLYIFTTTIVQFDASDQEEQRQRETREKRAEAGAYMQMRMAASMRTTRWLFVGAVMPLLQIWVLAMEGDGRYN